MFSFKKIFEGTVFEKIRQLGSKLCHRQLGSKQSLAWEFLPEDLLVNILSRLPLKDIFRYKLVCKSWLKLISSPDPYFTSNYVRNSPFTLIFRSTGYFLTSHLSLLEFGGKGGGEYTHITIPKLPDQASGFYFGFIGSCDCSIFVLQYKPFGVQRVYLFNPVLGSCVKVTEDRNGKQERWKYKVGFIPSNSTYKLVRFVFDQKKGEKVEIFTVGGLDIRNWRKVDDDPLLFYGALNSSEGVICLNGSYHWLSSSSDFGDDIDDTIFTFDLLEEKHGTRIPKPHGVSRLSKKTRVTTINGRLSLADVSEENNSVTMVIWSMREYGVVESWSRVLVLTLCDVEYPQKWRYDGLVPIAVLANGDILFVYERRTDMWFYNLRKKRLTQINKLPDSGTLYRLYENTYVPNFYKE